MRLDGVLEAVRRLEEELRVALAQHAPEGIEAGALCEEVEAAVDAGRFDDARSLLERLETKPLTPSLRARALLARSSLDPATYAAPSRFVELLLAQADALERSDPALAARLLADAALTSMTGDHPVSGVSIALRARDVASRAGGAAEAIAALALEVVSVLTGRSARSGATVARVLETMPAESGATATTLHRIGALCLWSEDYVTARAVLERAVADARGGPHGLVAVLLDTLAAVDVRTGRWPSAEARAREALRLAHDLGQRWQQASCQTTLAALAALTGRTPECTRRASEALELAPGSALVFSWATYTVALAELGADRPANAVVELEKLFGEERIGASAVQWLPLLVEAYVRVRRTPEALVALDALEQDVAALPHLGPRALVARCRGLVAPATAYREHFEAALELHAQLPMPFERARTELCFGERLRRGRHRAEAEPLLRSAVATFERLGAVPWTARARRELEAASRRRAHGDGVLAQLTPHEMQVASLVGRGATNREVATALFVSPKTVDYHLRNIYAKLAIRSRTELARLMLRDVP